MHLKVILYQNYIFLVPNQSFQLENEKYNKICLSVGKPSNRIFGTNCSSSPNERWILVNRAGKRHLVNIMTLQCLEFLTSGSLCEQKTGTEHQRGHVTMTQCNATDGQYLWGNDTRMISSKLCSGKKHMYLQFKNDSGYSAEFIRTSSDQSWISTNKQQGKKTSTYKGQWRKPFLYLID